MTNEELTNELARIGEKHSGYVRPSDVVRAAKAEQNPLHDFFEWDDSRAAIEHRLEQARHLIRSVTVTIIHGDEPVVVRAFVSLREDRGEGSYRQTVVLLNSRDTREQLLEEAVAEMEAFQRKYKRLSEVSEVIEAMSRASRKLLMESAGNRTAQAAK